jgi:hypothetical protein
VEEALSEGRVGQKRAGPREMEVQVSKKKLRTVRMKKLMLPLSLSLSLSSHISFRVILY